MCFLDDDDDDARLIQVHRMPGLSLVDVPVVVRSENQNRILGTVRGLQLQPTMLPRVSPPARIENCVWQSVDTDTL